jgi:hypothetical protein
MANNNQQLPFVKKKTVPLHMRLAFAKHIINNP